MGGCYNCFYAESGPGAAATASAPQVTSLRGAATTASTAAKGTRGSLRLQLGRQQGQLEGGLQRLFRQQGRRGGAATTARHRQWFTGTYCGEELGRAPAAAAVCSRC